MSEVKAKLSRHVSKLINFLIKFLKSGHLVMSMSTDDLSFNYKKDVVKLKDF